MAETNTNTQNSGTAQTGNNNNQESTQATQQSNQNNNQQNTNTSNNVDVEAVKKQAQVDLLKQLGYSDTESLSTDIGEYKKYLDSQKTAQEKVQGTLDETTKQLAEEREARIVAEAKVEAMKLGVKPGLVNDVVLIAKSRVTKDKDIVAVLTEMKDNSDENVYFEEKEEETEGQNKNKGRNNVTRGTISRANMNNQNNNNSGDNTGDSERFGKHAGTMAARLLQNTRSRSSESYYFGKNGKGRR